MFELLNEDLEDCIEILREISSCKNRNEQLQILAEHQIRLKDLQKTIDLCKLMVYYDDRIQDR